MGCCSSEPEHARCQEYRNLVDLRKKAQLALIIASDYESDKRLASAAEWYGNYQRCMAVFIFTRFEKTFINELPAGEYTADEIECLRCDALINYVQAARNNWRYLLGVHAKIKKKNSSYKWCYPPRPTDLNAPQWDQWLQLVGRTGDVESMLELMGLLKLQSRKTLVKIKKAEVAASQAAAMAAASAGSHAKNKSQVGNITFTPNITISPNMSGATASPSIAQTGSGDVTAAAGGAAAGAASVAAGTGGAFPGGAAGAAAASNGAGAMGAAAAAGPMGMPGPNGQPPVMQPILTPGGMLQPVMTPQGLMYVPVMAPGGSGTLTMMAGASSGGYPGGFGMQPAGSGGYGMPVGGSGGYGMLPAGSGGYPMQPAYSNGTEYPTAPPQAPATPAPFVQGMPASKTA